MDPLGTNGCGDLSGLANTPLGWQLTALAALPFCLLLVYFMERGSTSPIVRLPELRGLRLPAQVLRTTAANAAAMFILLAATGPLLAQSGGPNELIDQACLLYDRLQTLASWVRNFFILVSVFILIFIGVQAYSGRLNWKHLAVLGGSVAILALAHLVPQFFFTGDCAAQNVTIVP